MNNYKHLLLSIAILSPALQEFCQKILRFSLLRPEILPQMAVLLLLVHRFVKFHLSSYDQSIDDTWICDAWILDKYLPELRASNLWLHGQLVVVENDRYLPVPQSIQAHHASPEYLWLQREASLDWYEIEGDIFEFWWHLAGNSFSGSCGIKQNIATRLKRQGADFSTQKTLCFGGNDAAAWGSHRILHSTQPHNASTHVSRAVQCLLSWNNRSKWQQL